MDPPSIPIKMTEEMAPAAESVAMAAPKVRYLSGISCKRILRRTITSPTETSGKIRLRYR